MTIEEAKKHLSNVLNVLIEQSSPANLAAVKDRISNIVDVFKIENNYIYVIVKDKLNLLLINRFDSRQMDAILQEILPEKYGFKFITQMDVDIEKEKNKTIVNTPMQINFDRSSRKLRAEFTFDNFVVGNSNRFAYTSAVKVAEAPNNVYNPLYIFGDVGLGKTHLMMAIGHYILDKDINTNIVFTTAQQFTEEYFVYTRKDNSNIDDFYNKYYSADILLVDDIQFLENKTHTQEEFFKIFDRLHNDNKQIVVTSDRPANELKIMNRLKSRFSWGMPVDIKTPDFELRIKILRKKLDVLVSNPNDVPDECLEVIADEFSANVRELEGALTRFVSYCVSMNLDFSKESVYIALDGMLQPRKQSESKEVEDKIHSLIDIVTKYFQISEEDLLSQNRKPNLVYARNICYYVLRGELNLSLTKIGEFFNKKDHTSISYGVNKIKEQIQTNLNVKNDINYIKDKLV
ncbi:MAG: chromosomal replication initiator protein DnaA [Bacilli bacterium]|nr:chromosomal replication initiator protein DnaA [Bacilli bacterium]